MKADDRITPPSPIRVARAPRDADEVTPPGRMLTAAEQRIVKESTRTFVKGIVPHLPALAKFGGPAAGFVLLMAQHWAGKAETDRKVDEVSEHATKETKWAYRAATKPARDLAEENAALVARITSLETTQAAQGALLAARERDFTVQGRPSPSARKQRIDPGLVRLVKANAAKDSKELAARAKEPVKAIATIPVELPPEPVKDKAAPVVQSIHDASNPSQ